MQAFSPTKTVSPVVVKKIVWRRCLIALSDLLFANIFDRELAAVLAPVLANLIGCKPTRSGPALEAVRYIRAGL